MSSTITVDSTDQMSYSTKEIIIDKSYKEVTITLTHSGNLPKNVMGHNLVISKTQDMQAIVTEGMSLGLDKGYLKADNPAIITATAMIGGGEQSSAKVDLPKLGRRGLLVLLHLPRPHLHDEGQSHGEVTSPHRGRPLHQRAAVAVS